MKYKFSHGFYFGGTQFLSFAQVPDVANSAGFLTFGAIAFNTINFVTKSKKFCLLVHFCVWCCNNLLNDLTKINVIPII